MERSADGVALCFGALIVGELGRGVVSARGSSLEHEAGDGESKLVALAVTDRLVAGPNLSRCPFGVEDAAQAVVAERLSSAEIASRDVIAPLADGELEGARLEPVDPGFTGAIVGRPAGR